MKTIIRRPHQKITKRENGSIRIQTLDFDESKTQQQYLEQSDINNIFKKYMSTGEITWTNSKIGQYADLLDMPDYQQALNLVIDANEAFDALPSSIRDRFQNDPHQLLEFIKDPNNKEEATKLGLLKSIPEAPMDSQILNELKTLNQNTKNKTNKNSNPTPASEET